MPGDAQRYDLYAGGAKRYDLHMPPFLLPLFSLSAHLCCLGLSSSLFSFSFSFRSVDNPGEVCHCQHQILLDGRPAN